MNIWRFTGNPENWITALTMNTWALNENNRRLWEKEIKPGDVVLFHSTRKSGYTSKAESAVIGFGYVGENLFKKEEYWWVQEVENKEVMWPYVVPLEEIYTYSDISRLDKNTPVSRKSKEIIVKEINILLQNSIKISKLNELAAKESSLIPKFPVNGSASRVNPFYEELLLNLEQDLYSGSIEEEHLEKRSAEATDYYYNLTPIDEVKKQVLTFRDSGNRGYKYSTGSKKTRIENQKQKRMVARLENYTCQVCGFHCKYTNGRGHNAWIYDVDHIIEKSDGGTEEASNLWVLCPNCHRKKTRGIITVDLEKKKVFENGKEIKLKLDSHLF